MDNKHHLRIVGFKVIDYTSKKTGMPGQLKLAQCVITSESAEKGQQVVVGELMMPKHLTDVPTGEYLAEFEISVGDGLRIGASLSKLHAINASPLSKSPAKAA